MSVVEHLLKTIKLEYPLISKAFLQSDNASCYHNGALTLSLPVMGERVGVIPLRYDFSDPQAGKDICDRKTAPMNAHIRRWVDEKHDVITAEAMKQALESHGGLKGCRAAVVEVDTTKVVNVQPEKNTRWSLVESLGSYYVKPKTFDNLKFYQVKCLCHFPSLFNNCSSLSPKKTADNTLHFALKYRQLFKVS